MGEKSIYSGYRWLMLLCVSLGILSASMEMIGLAPILGEIAEDLNVNLGSAANLMMGFVLAQALFLTWGGVVCDKYGITKALVLGLLCSSVPAILMPWVGSNFKAVFLSRLVQGASMGFIFSTVGPVLALWFPPKEQGLAGGLMISSFSLGSALGALSSPYLLGAIGDWQRTVATLSIPGWIGIVLALLITKRPPSPEVLKALTGAMKSVQAGITFRKALTFPMTWIGTFILFCNAWGLYGLYNLVPPYLATKAPVGVGLSPDMVGTLSLALTVTGIFAVIIGGIFFDKVAKGNHRLPIIIGFIVTAIASYLMLSPDVCTSLALLVICLMIAGWGMPFMNAPISAFIAMNYPPDIVGRMVGWWFGFGSFGGALGIYLGGISIARFSSFYWAIILISIACAVGLVLAFFLKPRRV